MKPLLVLIGCSSVVGCSDLSLDVRSLTELERAEARWDRSGLHAYVYALRRVCFCPVELLGPVRVRVEDGVAVERAYVDTGEPVPPSVAESFPPVEGLFEMLREAYRDGADEVIVSYHPDLGYPTQLAIDRDEQVADEEISVTVTEDPVAIPVFLPSGTPSGSYIGGPPATGRTPR